jgi:hypothetical protein
MSPEIVERAFDGQVAGGRPVEPRAYAAFLRAAIAEAQGDTSAALAAYVETVRVDPRAAEAWTRLGALRCRVDPPDPQVDAAFARASGLQPDDAGVWSARASCALARGDIGGARALARNAVALDPHADAVNLLLASIAPPQDAQTTRATLVALTVTARDQSAAWDALATWAHARREVGLWAYALAEIARAAPARRAEVARAAEELSGVGQTWEARVVASAAADADDRPFDADRGLAARLALDEAIARGDVGAVSDRATRLRLPLDEAAGRAFLARRRSLAHDLVASDARADPGATGARLVLAAIGAGDVFAAAHDATSSTKPIVSAGAFVAFACALTEVMSQEDAGAALARLAHAPIVAGDDVVVRPAVDLVARGVLGIDALPADGVVELAAREGGGVSSERLAALGLHALDARHEYLALALLHPDDVRTKDLGVRLEKLSPSDPVVAAASALAQLGVGGTAAGVAARALLAHDVGDPLLAAAALRLAERAGDGDIVARARAALRALGKTGRSLQ